jgi:hypothetical protein
VVTSSYMHSGDAESQPPAVTVQTVAVLPLAPGVVAGNPRTGWRLTKVPFGVLSLYLLGMAHALD